jgi:hypothetical protein
VAPPAKAGPAKPAPVKKTKKKRRILRYALYAVAALVLLLIGLVLLIPTIVSSSAVRGIIISQANQQINGTLDIQKISLGWNSPIEVDGITIKDSTGRQILQLPHFSTGITLVRAMRGDFDLGKTEVAGLNVVVSTEPDGSINWTHLAKESPKPATPAKPEPAPAPEKPLAPSKLPAIKGEFILSNCNITYEDRSPKHQPPVYIKNVQADLKFPDLNQPITDSFSAQIFIGQPTGTPGTVSVTGSLSAIKNSEVDMKTPSVDQTITTKGLDLSAVSPFLGPDLKVTGIAGSELSLKLVNGTDATAQAKFATTGLSAQGKALSGTSFKSEEISFVLPPTKIKFTKGLDDPSSANVQIGDAKTPLVAQLKNANVTEGEGASARPVLKDYTLTFQTAASYNANTSGRDVKITALDLHDSAGLFSVSKAPDKDVSVTLPTSGSPTAAGAIGIQADLKKLNDLAQSLQAKQVAVKDDTGMVLKNGRLDGGIELAVADANSIKLSGNFALSQLTVGDKSSTPIDNQGITLVVEALANHDLSKVDVPMLDVVGDLITVHGSNIHCKLSNGTNAPAVPPLQMLQTGDLEIKVPQLRQAQLLGRALSPATQPTTRPATPEPKTAVATAGTPAPAAEPTTQPTPPMDITSGSAGLAFHAESSPEKFSVTQTGGVSNLGIKCGTESYDAGNINLDSLLEILTAAAPAAQPIAVASTSPTTGPAAPGLIDTITEIQVPKFSITAPNLGNLDMSLVEPIRVVHPGGLADLLSPKPGAAPSKSSLGARFLLRGNTGPLLTFVSALSGKKPEHQINAVYAMDEQLTADPTGAIVANGRADLNNLVYDGRTNPETGFRVASLLALRDGFKTLDLRNFEVLATTTNSLDLSIKGMIHDLGGEDIIDHNMTVDLAYDLAPLWKILDSVMTPDQQKTFEGLELTGNFKREFIVSGKYPSTQPFNIAVQSVLVYGDVQMQHFLYKGLDLENALLPVTVKDGIATVAEYDPVTGSLVIPTTQPSATTQLAATTQDVATTQVAATTQNAATTQLATTQAAPTTQGSSGPIACNKGTIDLRGVSLDLRGEQMLLNSPHDLKIFDKISLNPAVAAWGLGDMLNNPLYVSPKDATGQLSLVMHSCQNLPLDPSAKTGSASLEISIGAFSLGSPDLAKYIPGGLLSAMRGEVPSYKVNIHNGILDYDFTIALTGHKRPLRMTGIVDMATKQLVSANMDLPWTFFSLSDKNLQKYLPEGIEVPFTGTSNNARPAVDVNQLTQKYMNQAGQKMLTDQATRLLGGNKNAPADTQPASGNPQQDTIKSLTDTLGGLFNKKKQ